MREEARDMPSALTLASVASTPPPLGERSCSTQGPDLLVLSIKSRYPDQMLGAIIGDIAGSVYEWKNVRTKEFGPLFHPKAFYTDDTVCTIAVADALVHDRHAGEALKDWGRRYWENGGWGAMFAQWLMSDSMGPYNSFGNGAAMRVSPAGLRRANEGDAISLAESVTWLTLEEELDRLRVLFDGDPRLVNAYHALIAPRSPAVDLARDFVGHLAGPAGQAVMSHHGRGRHGESLYMAAAAVPDTHAAERNTTEDGE